MDELRPEPKESICLPPQQDQALAVATDLVRNWPVTQAELDAICLLLGDDLAGLLNASERR